VSDQKCPHDADPNRCVVCLVKRLEEQELEEQEKSLNEAAIKFLALRELPSPEEMAKLHHEQYELLAPVFHPDESRALHHQRWDQVDERERDLEVAVMRSLWIAWVQALVKKEE